MRSNKGMAMGWMIQPQVPALARSELSQFHFQRRRGEKCKAPFVPFEREISVVAARSADGDRTLELRYELLTADPARHAERTLAAAQAVHAVPGRVAAGGRAPGLKLLPYTEI